MLVQELAQDPTEEMAEELTQKLGAEDFVLELGERHLTLDVIDRDARKKLVALRRDNALFEITPSGAHEQLTLELTQDPVVQEELAVREIPGGGLLPTPALHVDLTALAGAPSCLRATWWWPLTQDNWG
ncbi:hypothetical protein PF007_g30542 [Phytophthora fragariae]|uniref:Uncharacterized protein n=1 Tax=Phytophthora fragariae TaxID=53985 RepID=A0A6A3PS75_9STRA|nr:hypothetical protein PF003_g23582 [Phytophthora fragariae]KAE9060613.1 hypothetical protein PF007_g30542 [Phytophthora fragariae]